MEAEGIIRKEERAPHGVELRFCLLYTSKNLKEHGSAFFTETKVTEVRKEGIVGERNGEKIELSGYQSVVLALGSRSYVPLKKYLEDLNKTLYVLGDASSVRDAKYAIFDAAKLALSL